MKSILKVFSIVITIGLVITSLALSVIASDIENSETNIEEKESQNFLGFDVDEITQKTDTFQFQLMESAKAFSMFILPFNSLVSFIFLLLASLNPKMTYMHQWGTRLLFMTVVGIGIIFAGNWIYDKIMALPQGNNVEL